MSATVDSSAWDRRYAKEEFVWTVDPNRFLVQEAAGLRAGRALDLACGEGRNAVWLAERGWEVFGVDFSAAGIAKTRTLADERGVNPHWVVADLADYQPEPRAYDLVTVLYLQLPAVQRTPIIRRAAAAVAPGGTLLVVAHDRTNLEHGHGGPQDPTVLYTAEDVAADLAGSGMRVERADRVQRPVTTPDGECVALDALLRATRP
ncbi:MAG: class I SAM-dependent methyltransferase [Solirubrobacteraceae bacterium]